MWALLVIVIWTATPTSTKTVGSIQMRFNNQEECLTAKSQIEKTWTIDRHRVSASCGFRGYLGP
jgi:hypothetical protein